jgi:hypothetical protein
VNEVTGKKTWCGSIESFSHRPSLWERGFMMICNTSTIKSSERVGQCW